MSASRIILLITLPIISVLGFYNTFYTARLNGTGNLLFSVLRSGPEAEFPGTKEPLLREYTRLSRVDGLLTMLVAFFAHTVDGSLLWFGRYGVGQFGAAWAVLVMEGFREGNNGRIVSWTGALGLLIQVFAFTCMTPLYLFLTLLTSPVSAPNPSRSSLLISSTHLKVLPISIFLSYIVPSLLMSLDSPENVTSITHQRLIALWQIFPALTVIIHYVLTKLSTQHSVATVSTKDYIIESKTLQKYILALSVSTHILPLSSSLKTKTFRESFIPFSLTHSATTPVPNLATGVKNFLQWDIYIGVFSIFIWSTHLYWTARQERPWKQRGLKLVPRWQLSLIMLLGGPLSVAVVLLGEREKMLLSDSEGDDATKQE